MGDGMQAHQALRHLGEVHAVGFPLRAQIARCWGDELQKHMLGVQTFFHHLGHIGLRSQWVHRQAMSHKFFDFFSIGQGAAGRHQAQAHRIDAFCLEQSGDDLGFND